MKLFCIENNKNCRPGGWQLIRYRTGGCVYKNTTKSFFFIFIFIIYIYNEHNKELRALINYIKRGKKKKKKKKKNSQKAKQFKKPHQRNATINIHMASHIH